MLTSLADARFFVALIDPIVRGQQSKQDFEAVRRYFRAYLHCWKSIIHYVREAKSLKNRKDWIAWCGRWQSNWERSDRDVFECLRKIRDYDTHRSVIAVEGELAAGLFPIVMFQSDDRRQELISVCLRGLVLVERLIQEYPSVS